MKDRKLLLVLWGLCFITILCGCEVRSNSDAKDSPQTEQIAEQETQNVNVKSYGFNGNEVPLPRICYYIHGPKAYSGLFYIAISEEEACRCRQVISNGEYQYVKPKDYVGLFNIEFQDGVTAYVFESMEGGYYIASSPGQSYIADECIEPLHKTLDKISGADTSVTLKDFCGMSSVQILSGNTVIWETSDASTIEQIETLLNNYEGSSVSNFSDYVLEVKCSTTEGKSNSFCLAIEDGYIFLPPLRYYSLKPEDPARQTGWLEILGWEDWPEKIYAEKYLYEDGFFDDMYERLNIIPNNVS